jgi:hypothetical protein
MLLWSLKFFYLKRNQNKKKNYKIIKKDLCVYVCIVCVFLHVFSNESLKLF